MAQLNYKTYSDLLLDIKKNINKLPSGIDLVVGIPRSGMIPAYMIGFALNTKVCSFDEFINDITISNGQRPLNEAGNTILIVDDSSWSGGSINRAKCALSNKNIHGKTIYFLAVYVTREARDYVDFWFVTLPLPRMFQWNYMNHGYIEQSCFDIDGVLCVDPTEEENDDGDKYRRFILNAKPLYIPHYNIYALVTSRLEKYRKETEEWLKKNNVQYKHLYMLDLSSKEERIRLNAHAKFKAEIYRRLDDTVLFYESNLSQAHEIAKITQKAVFCVETDELIKNYRNFSWHGSKERKTKKIIKKILRKIIKKILRMVIFKKSWRIKIREIIKRFVIRQSNKKNIEIRCRYKWLGTTYGGFDVCLDALDVKKKQEIIVYSAGVGCDISFDMELMKRYENIKILAFDPTPISLEWIKKQRIPPNYRFYPVGISDKEGKEKMYLPESHGVSFTVHDWDVSNKDTVEVKMETIGGIMQKNGHEFVDILKLDIEGSEFSVLRTIDFKSQFFGQILVEFHDRFIEDGEKELKRTINILRENGYYCFACSPFHEYSFINVRHIRNK